MMRLINLLPGTGNGSALITSMESAAEPRKVDGPEYAITLAMGRNNW
jgi:hypothetical protein